MVTQPYPKKAAIYIRVSTSEQAETGYSLSAQETLLRDYCAKNTYEVYAVYADEGKSAKDLTHRPGALQLMEDASHGRFDLVIIWRLSRLTRSLRDLEVVCAKFDKRNISLISYTEHFDCSTPTGRAMRAMIGIFAQLESEIIAENVRMTMMDRVSKGARSATEMLGYNIAAGAPTTVNHREAAIVRYIYDEYRKTKSFLAVSKLCDKHGYRGKRGGKLSAEHIYRMLTRPTYAGYNMWQGEPISVGTHPPIIPLDEYNAMQTLISIRSKRSVKPIKKDSY